MNFKLLTGSIVVVILFFFGLIFAIASAYQSTRIITAIFFFFSGFGVIVLLYISNRRPDKVTQKIEFSGKMETTSLKCTNCSASIQPTKMKIIDGVPYVICEYCGNTMEVTEEPKW